MKPILEIKGISKKYQIQSNAKPYLSLRESLFSFLKPSSQKEEFWALQDVSFDVQAGDTIGIIGKNGAGKSTLLKILSKITPPTSGNITCRGRIASLLEVGTGFHSELSGRENVFFNGSILGMKRKEILKNFDAIVDFANVEKFIDTPLKHYSSGMQLRLAFAVAAFLENEILIVDEVLAVGDAEFQKKCIGKMGDISKSGRTVLFVSHNLVQLKDICEKSILLEKGAIIYSGKTVESIAHYQNKLLPGKVSLKNALRKGPSQSIFQFTDMVIANEENLLEKNKIQINIEFTTTQKITDLVVGVLFSESSGTKVLEVRSNQSSAVLNVEKEGDYTMQVEFDSFLKSNIYSLSIGARSKEGLLEYLPDLYTVEIKPNAAHNHQLINDLSGSFIINSNWKLQ
ncbi:ABC transporter ATP-binding protein [Aurantibacillus circumpalustris]|uniref:ABC transporter ATP-binding protein n=1 Tax=Aurantibacillus circumpalustris TaxID=3036359 RepID=UPI00295C202A|nr:polysaccharide ABC transporter ATP-binding protein [Aurantibacillus circumpalustris]